MSKKTIKTPPRFGKWIFNRMREYQRHYSIAGDVEEVFFQIYEESGFFRAWIWYWYQCIFSLIEYLMLSTKWSMIMFTNYFKVALRNLVRYKIYSFINVLGLTIGIASCVLILLYVKYELSYDKHHEKSDQIYRLTREWFNSDGSSSLHLGHVAPPIAPLIKNDFPNVLQAVRLRDVGSTLMEYNGKFFQESQFLFADPEVFEVFTFTFLQGDPKTALSEPNNIIIASRTAKKYFDEEDPFNKTLVTQTPNGNNIDLKITGVIEEIPDNSHYHFDMLGSMKALELMMGEREFRSWGSNNYATYLLFPKGYDVNEFKNAIPEFIGKHHPNGERAIGRTTLHLQKLTDIHLHSHLDSEMEANGNIIYVYIFAAIAFFLLLIACINFMNLATARAASRAREVGLRKVVGAEKRQLIKQFIGESIILAFIALFLAILVVFLTLPEFNKFVNKDLDFNLFNNLGLIFSLIIIALFTGLVSGSYPAFYLSRFQPSRVLQSNQQTSSGKSVLRKTLVVFQFATSIILIIGMGVVSDQLQYCQDKNLGIDKENILILPASSMMIQRYSSFQNQLVQHPNIISVSASKRVPSGRLLDSSGARLLKEDGTEPLDFRIANVRVSMDFIDTYRIELAAGRNFSTVFPTDSMEAFILNETAVTKIGWKSADEAVGQPFGYDRRRGRIIGVVKDFHYESLHEPVTPIVLMISPGSFNSISVRYKPQNAEDITSVLNFLQNKWQEYRPNYPFTYSFLDENYNQLYLGEKKLSQIFGVFSVIAIFIACLGLFGLASYSAEQKTKEIGIRKVMGANVRNIVFLLSKEFAVLVIIATLVSWPVAYLIMTRWLENFAYRVNLQLLTFFIAALTAFLIAFITVSYQAIKAAIANPIKSLRYE